MPGKNQRYGIDYRTAGLVLSPEEHRAYRMKSVEMDVTISEVCRLALADDAVWRKAARLKARERAARGAEKAKASKGQS